MPSIEWKGRRLGTLRSMVGKIDSVFKEIAFASKAGLRQRAFPSCIRCLYVDVDGRAGSQLCLKRGIHYLLGFLLSAHEMSGLRNRDRDTSLRALRERSSQARAGDAKPYRGVLACPRGARHS